MVVARYAWLREEGRQAGEMLLTPRDDEIQRLVVTFGLRIRSAYSSFVIAPTSGGSYAMKVIHTCYRITDPDKSIAFYQALGFEKRRELPIREEAMNYFLGLPATATGSS